MRRIAYTSLNLLLAFVAGLAPVVARAQPYMLNPGDTVEVFISGNADISRNVQVRSDGTIRLPLIPPIDVAGLSEDAVAKKVAKVLEAEGVMRQASVVVSIEAFRPIYVIGAVDDPGEHTFTPGMTVRQAVALAGGGGYQNDAGLDPDFLRPELAAQLGGVDSALAHVSAERGRLEAEASGADEIADAKGDRPSSGLEEAESQQFDLAKEIFDSLVSSYEEQLKLAEQETALLREQQAAIADQIVEEREELDRISQLRLEGLTSQDRLVSASRILSDLRRDQLSVAAALANIDQRRIVLESQRENADAKRRIAAVDALRALSREADETEARRLGLVGQLIHLDIIGASTSGVMDEAATLLIHRRVDGVERTVTVEYGEPVLPGDVVEVRIDPIALSKAASRLTGDYRGD